ncbi:2-hydroxyhepta-2,4-diene-1,7-dioate isomerase [Caballeronia novacaledonica]|uniref:2-hydroxyhepta-2,4-diene-1,7-dioate isomerase n=1 Tax=Caballeronia novacaledonica TaxID=1544861 RepID=A0ACB5R5C5_9BURK|nr:fumarylacetoacetate hydrolase family protein [Caballeronia sp. LZ029]MDR5748890.1 fumarylacetoacetate hydrolase family protein [Caballeronia sp. LZ029]GJH22535.1 2-hydroxyhepta-2,4-diene-1,7-dioate isomerase [Caballeronia novacaledonica]
MFPPVDYLVHLDGESLPRDVDADTLRQLLSSGKKCRPPQVGTVYGTLLNDRGALDALGDAVNAAPYKAPPKAPILYVRPRNALAGHGSTVAVPEGIDGVEIGGSVGIVIGRTACRVRVEEALDFVGGYVALADICIPHASVYRPSVRFRARDNFCVIGPSVVGRRHVKSQDELSIKVHVTGGKSFSASTATCVRKAARLIADVTEFMTLNPGDVLTLGVPQGSPIARAGDEVTVTIDGWASLRFSLENEEAIGDAR